MLYSPAIFLAKLSILLMYRRLFDTAGTGKTHQLIHILIWANLAFYFPYLGATVFQCVPRARIWDPTLKGGCINLQAAFIAASAINVVSDFSILLLPLYRISKLKIPTRRKIGVLAIFAVGLLYVSPIHPLALYTFPSIHPSIHPSNRRKKKNS